MNKQQVHWFPGHMKVALNQIEKVISIVDLVIEIGDARAPLSSLNPYLKDVVHGRPRVLIYAKKDLAEPLRIEALKARLPAVSAILTCDLKNPSAVGKLRFELGEVPTARAERYARRGLATPPLRALVLGIPNVGKSTFINALSGRRKAGVGNMPGWTRSQQLFRVDEKLEVYDTPGILPPDYEDKTTALRLSWLGALKTDILPLDEVFETLACFLLTKYPERLQTRYGFDQSPSDPSTLLAAIATGRHYLLKAGVADLARAGETLLKDFQSGALGRIIVDEFERI